MTNRFNGNYRVDSPKLVGTRKSARSARRHKARGVSPGIECPKRSSPGSGRQIFTVGSSLAEPVIQEAVLNLRSDMGNWHSLSALCYRLISAPCPRSSVD